MREIDSFLNKEFNIICNGDPQIQAIQYQYDQIKGKIDYIEDNI